VHVGAAATVVIYSLDATLSPPVQRVSRPAFPAFPRESKVIGTGHLFLAPGRSVSTSVVVADRRSQEPHPRGSRLPPSMLCVPIRLPSATNPHYRRDDSLRCKYVFVALKRPDRPDPFFFFVFLLQDRCMRGTYRGISKTIPRVRNRLSQSVSVASKSEASKTSLCLGILVTKVRVETTSSHSTPSKCMCSSRIL
jgi:hypothetical protein